MSNQIVETSTIESVIIQGDLSRLTPEQRVQYYQRLCQSLDLNMLTRPFDYITLNGKLTLYALKGATDQLRKKHNISISKPDITFQDEWIIVTIEAADKTGRTDSDIGVVSKKDMRGDFGNALMKAVTKAKRRVTLSICGLGMLDETEVETIPDAVLPVLPEMVGDIPVVIVGEPKMSLETAENVQNSEGIKYGDLESEKLSHMANSLMKALKKNDVDPQVKEEREYKLDAIRVILAARANE